MIDDDMVKVEYHNAFTHSQAFTHVIETFDHNTTLNEFVSPMMTDANSFNDGSRSTALPLRRQLVN